MKSYKPSEPAFRTADLTLASFLRCHGFKIEALEGDDAKTTFVFTDSAQLRKAMLEYANNGNVPVRTFSGTMRDLKAIIK